MPVLGSPSSSSSAAGTYDTGFDIPADWGANWRAARDAADTSLCEVAIFGDSTTAGNTYSAPGYSWVEQLRNRSSQAGYPDGGKGIIASVDIAGGPTGIVHDFPGEVYGLTSNGMTAIGGQFGPVGGQELNSTTAGETATLQGHGNNIRLYAASIAPRNAQLGVTIDGGTETILQLPNNNGLDFTGNKCWNTMLATGLASGLHTVALRNVGSVPFINYLRVTQAAHEDTNSSGATWGATGPWYYKVTCVTPNGESTPIDAGSATLANTGHNIDVQVLGQKNVTSWNLYRSATSGGTYSLVGSYANTVTDFGQLQTLVDTGAATTATSPPTTDTSGANTALNHVDQATVAIFNDTGIVYNCHATSGGVMANWVDVTTPSTVAPFLESALGLQPTLTSSLIQNWQHSSLGPSPQYANPKLAIWHLGFNDLTNMTAATDPITKTAAQVQHFCKLARAAGADPLVISGQIPLNTNAYLYGAQLVSTLRSVARSEGAAFVDFMAPLGPPSNWSTYSPDRQSPHLVKAGYVVQANYLWDKVLSL